MTGAQRRPELPRALLCDEDVVMRHVARLSVETCGFEVVAEAEWGREALALARATTPHLVVLDLAVAGDEGVGLIRQFHAAVPGCRVVVFAPSNTFDLAALDAGAYASLPKTDVAGFRALLTDLASGLSERSDVT